jgi:hypothetical protein
MKYDMISAIFSANFVMMENNVKSRNFGWKYASETGSIITAMVNSLNLWDSFYDQYGKKSGWEIDNDGDGLPDFLEVQGLLLSNGDVIYTSIASGTTDAKGMPEGYDTDDDNLSDGQELGQMYTITVSEGITTITPEPNNVFLHESFLLITGDGAEDGVWYIFDSNSDPRVDDSDSDHYNDDIDNRPWISALDTVDLGGGTYDLFVSGTSGYIHVDNYPNQAINSNILAYGGNQNWFGDVEIGSDGAELLMATAGCGIIATNDVQLYCDYGISFFQWSDYKSSVIDTYNAFPGISLNPISGIRIDPNNPIFSDLGLLVQNLDINGPAILPLFIQNVLSDNGLNSHSYYTNSTDRESMLKKIELSIKSNKPVILQELDPISMASNDPTVGIQLYQRDYQATTMYDIFTSTGYVTGHYVTITGMFIDEQANRRWLRVQSWGEEYYIDFDEFFDYNTAELGRLGSIITVE